MITVSNVCKHILLLIVREDGDLKLIKSRNGYTIYTPIDNVIERVDNIKGTFGISILITDLPTSNFLKIINELSQRYNISLFIPDSCISERVSRSLNLDCMVLPTVGTSLPLGGSWTMMFFELSKNNILSDIDSQLSVLYKSQNIYPRPQQIFNAFELTPMDRIKVLILGQDPYAKEGEAHGLAFSSLVKIPPSLRTIYKELDRTGFNTGDRDGNLTDWAEQGVFLLNTALTVQENKPRSHTALWSRFIPIVLEYVNLREHIVVMLWGKDAQEFERFFDKSKHLILKCGHPSPLNTSNPFAGCDHFRIANGQLKLWGLDIIRW